MLDVTNIRVRSFDINYLDVYWDISPCFEDVNQFEFYIARSEAQFGEYVVIAGPLINQFKVRDNSIRGHKSFYHQIYYRVICKNRNTGEEKVFPDNGGGVNLSAPLDLVGLEMARINNLKLKEFSGRKVWVYTKKTYGQRCQACYDPVASRKTKSRCANCFDTSWVGGYNAPVEVYAKIISPDDRVVNADFANIELENTAVLMGNYPELFEGDIIVEAENIRWRVGSTITKIKKSRGIIRQQAPLHRIPNGDIEYKVPVKLTDNEVKDLVAEPERNLTNPQNIESAKFTNALNSVYGPDK